MSYSQQPLHEIKNVGFALRLTLGLALIAVLIILAPFVVLNNLRLSIQYPLMAVLALIGSERVPDTYANMTIILSRWQNAFGMAFRIIFDPTSLNEKIYNVRGIYSYYELAFGILIMGSTFIGISYLARYLNASSGLVAGLFVAFCAIANLSYFLFINFSRVLTFILWAPLGALVCISSTVVGYFLMIFDFIRYLFGHATFDPQKYNNQEFVRYYSSFSKIEDGFADRANFPWSDVDWQRAAKISAQTVVFYVALALITFVTTLLILAG
jgi:hypothetical protein